MRKLVSKLETMIPDGARQFLLGSSAEPSRLANGVHTLLNRLPGERITALPCGGVLEGYRMKVDWSRHRSFVSGSWEPTVVNAIAKVVQPGTCAVDVGAHIGFYTLLLAKLVGSHGKVFAFEPLPWNFAALSENVQINNCAQVELINKALLDHACELQANVPDGEPLPGSVSFSTPDEKKHVRAAAVSLDDFLCPSEQPVQFMKIDVEGAESLVLQGACKTIEENHPAMMIEVHHFDGSQPDDSPVIGQLQRWGYKIQWLNRWKETSHLFAS